MYQIIFTGESKSIIKDALSAEYAILVKRDMSYLPGFREEIGDKLSHFFSEGLDAYQDKIAGWGHAAIIDKINSDSGEKFTADEVDTISHACEHYLRVRMGQFDFGVMPLDVSSQVKSLIESCGEPVGVPSQSHESAFDYHRLLRHRVSWDRAGNPESRDWSTMAGVTYDEPPEWVGRHLTIERTQ